MKSLFLAEVFVISQIAAVRVACSRMFGVGVTKACDNMLGPSRTACINLFRTSTVAQIYCRGDWPIRIYAA